MYNFNFDAIDDNQIDEETEKMMNTPSILKSKVNLNVTEEDLAKVNKKAYLDALQGFLKTAYQREMVRAFACEGKMPYVPKDETMKTMLHNQMDALATKPPFMLVTVNPRNNVSLKDFKKKIEKIVKKKSVLTYAYVYEVRRKDEGLHSHILLEYDDKPYNFKRGIKNTVKNICDSDNPHCLNFKFVEEQHLNSKLQYLLGNKKDSKMKGVSDSEVFRTENKLDAIYESCPPLPCRATQTAIAHDPVNPQNQLNINFEKSESPTQPLGKGLSDLST